MYNCLKYTLMMYALLVMLESTIFSVDAKFNVFKVYLHWILQICALKRFRWANCKNSLTRNLDKILSLRFLRERFLFHMSHQTKIFVRLDAEITYTLDLPHTYLPESHSANNIINLVRHILINDIMLHLYS